MKLVIQIPCHNEEDNILNVLNSIPKSFDGIDEVETVIINDGSNDNTLKVIENYPIHIIGFKEKKGLSAAFRAGVEYALLNKADILVNIDGDNQYDANCIEKLISPIIKNECDITIGARPINKIKGFSRTKKFLQRFGSFMVHLISGANIKDAASGFRAFNRNSLIHLNIFNPFTYTIESIIQAHNKNLTIKNVDIDVNEQKNRSSKLFKNNFQYIFIQANNLIRFFIIYRPARFFIILSILFFFPALILGIRFLHYYLNSQGSGHIQSLILCTILFFASFACAILAILGDLLSINRKMLEQIRYEQRYKKYFK